MRAFRAAFHPLLLAGGAGHQITFRPHQEVNDEPEKAGNHGHDREQNGVVHAAALRVFVNPERKRDPDAEDDDAEDAGASQAREARDGTASGFARARTLFGGLREQVGKRKQQGKAKEKSLHV